LNRTRRSALALALPFALLAALPLAAKEKSPIQVTVKDEAGAAVAKAKIELAATSGEPFTVTGETDGKGVWAGNLPDFSRVYSLKVTREGFVPFEQPLDFVAQKIEAGMTAQLAVTLTTPKGPTAEQLYNEGVTAIQKGDMAAAEAKIRQALDLKPQLAQGWMALAMVLADGKRWPEALEACDKALGMTPDNPALLRIRFEALDKLGRADEASAALDVLVAKAPTPETAVIAFNQGAQATNRGDLAVARHRFDQALALNPSLYQAHSALAELHVRDKDYAGALAELEKAEALSPKNTRILERKVEVLRALGKKDEAAAAEKQLADLKANG
jgi:tetratricopeptide (TPR) repeat protein